MLRRRLKPEPNFLPKLFIEVGGGGSLLYAVSPHYPYSSVQLSQADLRLNGGSDGRWEGVARLQLLGGGGRKKGKRRGRGMGAEGLDWAGRGHSGEMISGQ